MLLLLICSMHMLKQYMIINSVLNYHLIKVAETRIFLLYKAVCIYMYTEYINIIYQ